MANLTISFISHNLDVLSAPFLLQLSLTIRTITRVHYSSNPLVPTETASGLARQTFHSLYPFSFLISAGS